MTTVSFPGLGIGEFTIDRLAFTIPIFGGIKVYWYGILITLGIILAVCYAAFRAKQEGIIFDDLLDIVMFAVVFGIIGARVYYVIFSESGQFKTFYDVIAIWNGGIAIYGAVIGGAAAIFATCKYKSRHPEKKTVKWQKMFDVAAPAVMIGQILGRWGNFFNAEAFGSTPSEDSILYVFRMGLQKEGWSRMYYYQPTFLYESVWNLIGFLLINAFYKKKKYDGNVFLWYITWYGFGRMFIEGLREDSLYLGVFRVSQVLGFLLFVAGSIMLVYFGLKARRRVLAEGDYDSVYDKLLRRTPEKTAPTEKPEENTALTAEPENTEDEGDGGNT